MPAEDGSPELQAWIASRDQRMAAYHEKHPRPETARPEIAQAPSLQAHETRFYQERKTARVEVVGRAACLLDNIDELLGIGPVFAD